MADTPRSTDAAETPGAATAGITWASLRVDFWLFVVMLALAIAGVAVMQIDESGGLLYWSFLVVVYAAIGMVRSGLQARRRGQPVWPMIRSQFLHWIGTLVAIKIVLLFEYSDITNRGSASDFSLLILALSCYLAGVHFNWTFLLLGGVLAVVAVGVGYLNQLSIFALMLPLAALAAWIVFKRKSSPSS
jgi:hypothetical protein